MGDFEERIRGGRDAVGLSQQDLAERLGVGQQAVSQWEAGLALPRPQRIVQLATVLDLDVEELWRLAGFLPGRDRVDPPALSAAMLRSLDDDQLWQLVDRAWQELSRRRDPSVDRSTGQSSAG